MRFLHWSLLALVLALNMPVLVHADGPTALAKVQTEDIEHLIKTLENDQNRQQMIRDLKLLIQANQGKADHEALPQATFLISECLHNCGHILSNWKDHLWVAIKVFKPASIQRIMLELGAAVLLSLAIAFALEWGFLKLFRRMKASLEERAQQGLLNKWQVFIIRLAIQVPALLVFSLAAFITLQWLSPQPRVKQLSLFFIALSILLKAGHKLSTITLSPTSSALRIIPLKENTAQLMHRFLNSLGLSIGAAYGLTSLFQLLQAPREAIFFMARLSTLAIGGLILISLGRFRAPINHWLTHEKFVEGKTTSGMNRFIVELGRSWYPMLIGYVLIMMGVMFGSDAGRYQHHLGLLIQTSAVIVVAYLLILTIPKILKYGLKHIAERYPLIKPRIKVYRRIFSAILLVLIVIGTIIYCATLWNISLLTEFFATRNQRLFLQIFSLTFILIVGITAWEINELLVERKFNQPSSKHHHHPISPEALKRLRTLQPLIRNTVRSFILLFVTLMLFSELGLNIAPLLAGASVFGIALSLGGQTLVKDIITGSFILIEDTMNIGDYVEISGHSGRIETMSLRTVTLRDSYGGVHSIPFSSINTIVNLSKTFSICIFNFTLDQTVDIKTVQATLQSVTQTMQAEPEWSNFMLGSIEVMGVTAFDGGSYTLRSQLRVAPGKQWLVEREINWRFAKAFEKDGIKFPTNKQWIIVENASDHKV